MSLFWVLVPLAGVLGITPLAQKAALKTGLLDRADGDPLKIHAGPVALAGGSALAAVFIPCLFFSSLVYGQGIARPLGLILAGLMTFTLGLADDLKPLPPLARIIVHFLAGIVIVVSGISLGISLWWGVSFLITLLFIAGSINAFNMIDGMDGLCATMALFSSIGFSIVGAQQHNSLLLLTGLILAGSLAGFLPYNLYPAKIFLGDSGSGFLGVFCGAMAVIASRGGLQFKDLAAPLLILGLPLADMAAAIIRRILRNKPLFKGDRDHLYDLLLKKGMTQAQVWGIMSFLQAICIFTGIMVSRL